jgi:hypothetical protein
MGFMLSAKPTLGAVTIVSGFTRPSWRNVIGGAAILTGISLLLFPGWPIAWMRVLTLGEFTPAVLWPGGFLGLLAAARWRDPEARMILALTLVPITASWYEALPLMLAGRSKREVQVLSLVSSAGYLTQGFFSPGGEYVPVRYTRMLLVAFCYVPALIVVLRRRRSGI